MALPPIRFRGTLRPAQQDIVEVAKRQLAAGERRLHVVAPPGAGKTILGLYLWSACVGKPALVLSPNSAIQAQWAAKLELFEHADELEVSCESAAPGHLTSLTYQALTLPARGKGSLKSEAHALWLERLLESGEANDEDAGRAWIADLEKNNPDYAQRRLTAYRKQAREARALQGKALEDLHAASRALIERLVQRGVGMIIFDECHHLLGHWGRVLGEAVAGFDDPVILGLTATPPEGAGYTELGLQTYRGLFGAVDYQIPVPAVVKDGFLAPYQDLMLFVRPTDAELRYLASVDGELHDLAAELRKPVPGRPDLLSWTRSELAAAAGDWLDFERARPGFSDAARRLLLLEGQVLPEGVPPPAPDEAVALDPSGIQVAVIESYLRRCLRLSAREEDQQLAERAVRELRLLGVQVTETGSRACASPVSRILAHSRSKARALVPILRAELEALGENLRAVVICDYEKSSASRAEVVEILDAEAGGAMASFRALLADPLTDSLDPVLVTGSSLLVDDDLAPRFMAAAREWIAARELEIRLEDRLEGKPGHQTSLGRPGAAAQGVSETSGGFHVVRGSGPDWCPRHYVMLVTELFERGLSRCLVGTRGLLGEGWDARRINVLLDLTTVTTSMTANQLRGRSIRLDPSDPQKLADNWDVICIAPEFARGLDDYRRFVRKHKVLWGVTEDGSVEAGPGHVHAAFGEAAPEDLEGLWSALNAEMLTRPARREEGRAAWRIGEPFPQQPVSALELKAGEGGGGFPPFSGTREPWSTTSLSLAVGRAILATYRQRGELPAAARLHTGRRAGGYVRLFLERADPEQTQRFSQAWREALGPLDRPRYLIPRQVEDRSLPWLARLLPNILARYFERRKRRLAMWHAVPSDFSRNKEQVATFQLHWNVEVSPGEALFAQRGEGREVLEQALAQGLAQGLAADGKIREKSVWW